MRGTLMIVGLILLLAGAAAFSGLIEYPREQHVLKIGDVQASVTHERSVPQWIGALAALVGLGLLVAGATKR